MDRSSTVLRPSANRCSRQRDTNTPNRLLALALPEFGYAASSAAVVVGQRPGEPGRIWTDGAQRHFDRVPCPLPAAPIRRLMAWRQHQMRAHLV